MDNYKRVREIFNLFDKDSEVSALVKDLPNICKYLFKDNMTEEAVKRLFSLSDIEWKISFDDFYTSL